VESAPDGAGYAVTTEGQKLLDALEPLDAWAKRWDRRASPG
jgi:DNA-binding HxlR family transcriptional regulator